LEKAEKVGEECIGETGVDKEVANQLKSADFSNRSDKAEVSS
jgi:hypothetical protein